MKIDILSLDMKGAGISRIDILSRQTDCFYMKWHLSQIKNEHDFWWKMLKLASRIHATQIQQHL
jgi:hypothetical protein